MAQKETKPGGFEAFQQWMKDAPWSLVHGDFHPANCMLIEKEQAPSCVGRMFDIHGYTMCIHACMSPA